MPNPRVKRLILSSFRSYQEAMIETNRNLVVLCGDNGAGKTNVIEALSLFTAGRGFRRATFDEMVHQHGEQGFSLNLKLSTADDEVMLGTGLEPLATSRLYRVNGNATSVSDFADYMRVIWLTPQMDGLFLGAASDRRRFLDRLVLSLDREHGSRVNAFEKLIRSRNKILEENGDKRWLDALEKEAAEVAVAIAAARAETVSRLQNIIDLQEESLFPKAKLHLEGSLEQEIARHAALDVEDNYRKLLHDNRFKDRAAGRTLEGVHRSDLLVYHAPSGSKAEICSTGQQKALLIGIILAHAALVTQMAGFAPLILLDEVVAHLDPLRRTALYGQLAALNAQVFMTGADFASFSELEGVANIFEVSEGRITIRP